MDERYTCCCSCSGVLGLILTHKKNAEKHGQNPSEEDKRDHAKWYVPTLRTWSNSTFYDALDTKRSEEERKVKFIFFLSISFYYSSHSPASFLSKKKK